MKSLADKQLQPQLFHYSPEGFKEDETHESGPDNYEDPDQEGEFIIDEEDQELLESLSG